LATVGFVAASGDDITPEQAEKLLRNHLSNSSRQSKGGAEVGWFTKEGEENGKSSDEEMSEAGVLQQTEGGSGRVVTQHESTEGGADKAGGSAEGDAEQAKGWGSGGAARGAGGGGAGGEEGGASGSGGGGAGQGAEGYGKGGFVILESQSLQFTNAEKKVEFYGERIPAKDLKDHIKKIRPDVELEQLELRGQSLGELDSGFSSEATVIVEVVRTPAEIPGARSGGTSVIHQGHEGHSYHRHSIINNIQLPEGDAAVPVAEVFAQNDFAKHSLDNAMKCAEAPTGAQNEAQKKTVEFAKRFYL
jgi:hypothetical protein